MLFLKCCNRFCVDFYLSSALSVDYLVRNTWDKPLLSKLRHNLVSHDSAQSLMSDLVRKKKKSKNTK